MPKKMMTMKVTEMIIGHLQCFIFNITLFMKPLEVDDPSEFTGRRFHQFFETQKVLAQSYMPYEGH